MHKSQRSGECSHWDYGQHACVVNFTETLTYLQHRVLRCLPTCRAHWKLQLLRPLHGCPLYTDIQKYLSKQSVPLCVTIGNIMPESQVAACVPRGCDHGQRAPSYVSGNSHGYLHVQFGRAAAANSTSSARTIHASCKSLMPLLQPNSLPCLI